LPHLTNQFLGLFGHPGLEGVPSELGSYTWPGKVRQLRRAVERAVFEAADEPVTIQAILERATAMDAPLDEAGTLRAAQARHIASVLRASDFDTELAAARLGLSRSQLYRKLRAFEIPLPTQR
jgi:transcriptional regulator of acetoin/glycerol metabolism